MKSRLPNGNFIIGHPNGETLNNIVTKYIVTKANEKHITWREEQNLEKVYKIEKVENERINMDTLLRNESGGKEYSCIFMECGKSVTYGLIDIHLSETHNVTRVKRG